MIERPIIALCWLGSGLLSEGLLCGQAYCYNDEIACHLRLRPFKAA